MRIESIAIGTELLTTRRLDTNSVWIAERLAELGLALHRKTAVGDDRADLRALVDEALGRSDVILCTGGLGPTFDDFTREVFAGALGVPLREDAQCRAELEAWYAARNRVPTANNYKQVLIPVGAEPLRNPLGSAPGIWWQDPPGHPGRRIVLMPGVPREMKRMWTDHVQPRLKDLAGAPVHTLRVVVGGVPESTLDERTAPVRARHGAVEWTILASLTHVEFVVRSPDAAALESARQDLAEALGPDRVCEGEGDLESTVLALLKARGETLAVAESMSGGLLAARLTAVPGASGAFLGGAVVYSPGAKVALAGLDPGVLELHGTVSEATTGALAAGIRARLGATWGLAISGNAGPSVDPHGEVERANPVGTCIIALAGPSEVVSKRFVVPGERPDVQLRAAGWSLDWLRRRLA
jgi:nicotinamide-nucleotide amidase